MTLIRAEVIGMAALRRDLRAIAPEVDKELAKALRSIVEVIAADARSRAPRRSESLRASIKPEVRARHLAIRSKAPHARVIEFGLRHPVFGNRAVWVTQKKVPFLFPAVEAHAEEAFEAVSAAFDDAVRRLGFI